MRLVRDWRLWLGLAIFSSPLLVSPLKLGFGRGVLTLPEILFLATAAIGCMEWLRSGEKESLPSTALPAACFLLVCVVSSLLAPVKTYAFWKTAHLIWFFFVYLVLASGIRTESTARRIVVILLLSGLAPALVGIYQYFFSMSPLEALIRGNRIRVYGFFENSAGLSNYLSGLIPLIVGLYIAEMGKKWDRILLWSLFAAALALAMTFMRSSWLGTVMGLFVLFLLNRSATTRFLRAAAVIAVAIAIVGVDMYSRRNLTFLIDGAKGDGTVVHFSDARRSTLMLAALKITEQHPLLGVGPGQFAKELPHFVSKDWLDVGTGHFDEKIHQWVADPNKRLQSAHNTFLQVAAETGLLGLAAFGWFVWTFFSVPIQSIRGLKSACLAGAAAIWFAQGLFGWPFTHTIQEILIVLMALTSSNWSSPEGHRLQRTPDVAQVVVRA